MEHNFFEFEPTSTPLSEGVVSEISVAANGFQFKKVTRCIEKGRGKKKHDEYVVYFECLSEDVPKSLKTKKFKSIGSFMKLYYAMTLHGNMLRTRYH